MLEVLSGGTLTTVQDAGRPGYGHLGVPRSGACDPDGLAVANLLLGNEADTAALELTLTGPALRAVTATAIGVGGADLGGITDRGRRILPGASYMLAEGEVVSFPGPAPGQPGLREYVALPGGVDVPVVLGSRSTCLVAGFGGLEGRALAPGDAVRARARSRPSLERRWPRQEADTLAIGSRDAIVRVLPGPADPAGDHLRELTASAWSVTGASDRMGIRLAGPALPSADGGMVLTHGVGWGAIQLPPDGAPVVLLADHQPTGGYPVVAVAIVADRPVLGQVRPGATLRFAPTTPAAARDALRRRRAVLELATRILNEDAAWDELWQGAGG